MKHIRNGAATSDGRLGALRTEQDGPALTFHVPIEVVAERVAELLAARETARSLSDWLDVSEAADYMRCGRQRIYDLSSSGRLRCAKDGARSLFRREWLDAYLEEGGS